MIRAKDYLKEISKTIKNNAEIDAFQDCTNKFIDKMREKFNRYVGIKSNWDDPAVKNVIVMMLLNAYNDSDWVSVGNYACMLENMED